MLVLSAGALRRWPRRSRGGSPDRPPADPAPWPLVAWTPIPENPVFTGTGRDTWDRKIRERGYILVGDDGTYHLWYTGYAGDRPPTMSLGHATSRDGIHWTRDPANPIFTDSWVEDMCVVTPRRHLLHVRRGQERHRASLDLHRRPQMDRSRVARHPQDRWHADQPRTIRHARPPGSRTEPGISFTSAATRVFGWRPRKTCKVWTNVKDDPVIAMGPEPYDKTAVAVNQIVKRDGFYYAFYHANCERPWKDWTTCLARSRDLVHWEKYPGNPIIRNNCSSAILVRTPQGQDRLYTMHPDVKVFVPAVG